MVKKIFFLIFSFVNLFNFHFKIRIIGNIFDKIRMKLLVLSGAKIGKNSVIHAGVFILNPNNLIIKENSSIGSDSKIFNYGKFIIGNNVDIGTDFYLNTNNHNFSNINYPISKQGGYQTDVEIKDDVWIGARVTILAKSNIESRVVLAAGTIVCSKLEAGNLYAGIPARKIKSIN